MQNTRRLTALLLTLSLALFLCPAAYADTDPSTPKITQQPDQLILQLGARWAGVEFELRTDAGVFPVPVVVDASGLLTMDLGGSTTYTLSCLDSTVPIPDPEPAAVSDPQTRVPDTASSKQDSAAQSASTAAKGNTGALLLFLAGLALAVFGGVTFYLAWRRQSAGYADWDDDEAM